MMHEEEGIWVTYRTKRAWVSSMHLVEGKEAVLRRLWEAEEDASRIRQDLEPQKGQTIKLRAGAFRFS